jgi:hypothetical protein
MGDPNDSQQSSNAVPSPLTTDQSTKSTANPSGFAPKHLLDIFSVGWRMMLLLGGLFTLFFFIHINFLPEIDLANSTALLASIALIGLFLTSLLCALFIAPSFILRLMFEAGIAKHDEENAATEQSVKNIVIAEQNINLVALGKNVSSNDAAVMPTTTDTNTTTHQVNVATSTSSNIVTQLSHQLNNDKHTFWIRALFSSILAIGFQILAISYGGYSEWFWAMLVVGIASVLGLLWLKKSIKNNGSIFLTYSALTALWFCLDTLMALPFLTSFKGESEGSLPNELFFWFLCLAFINIQLAGIEKGKLWYAPIFFGAISLILFLSLTNNSSLVTVSALRSLKLGEISGVSMVVTKTGYSMICKSVCSDSCPIAKDEEYFVVRPVTILSRIGSQYLVNINENSRSARVLLKKEDVIGWSEPDTSSNNNVSKSTQPKYVDLPPSNICKALSTGGQATDLKSTHATQKP